MNLRGVRVFECKQCPAGTAASAGLQAAPVMGRFPSVARSFVVVNNRTACLPRSVCRPVARAHGGRGGPRRAGGARAAAGAPPRSTGRAHLLGSSAWVLFMEPGSSWPCWRALWVGVLCRAMRSSLAGCTQQWAVHAKQAGQRTLTRCAALRRTTGGGGGYSHPQAAGLGAAPTVLPGPQAGGR